VPDAGFVVGHGDEISWGKAIIVLHNESHQKTQHRMASLRACHASVRRVFTRCGARIGNISYISYCDAGSRVCGSEAGWSPWLEVRTFRRSQ
jgi:hypothetical protein